MRPHRQLRAASLLLAFCLLAPGAALAQQPPPQQPDSALHPMPAPDAAPAQGHPGIDAQHYRFALTLHDDTDRIDGVATARVRFLTDTLSTFALDLAGNGGAEGMHVASVRRADSSGNGQALDFRHARDRLHVTLAASPETGATRTYRIRYAGVPSDGLIIAQNQFGDRTFFGDNWPTRARYWLPCVDHPADKATVAFAVTAPDAYQVIANGRLMERTDRPGPTSVTRYRTQARIPMKVAVIGAARFAVDYPPAAAGTRLESWVYPQSRAEGFHQLARAGRIVRFFSQHVGPFPFEKLANVESKTRYGGMENAGAIFYSEDAIAEGKAVEPLLAHEIAHQWFGDAVTETSYAHLWLSEGVATYLADLFIETTYGEARFRKRMRSERRRAAAFARQHPQTPLVNADYDDPKEMLNPFSYQKGAWVVHMLRRKIGDAAFWKGLQRYYRQYRGGNANTQDFRRAMEQAGDTDLASFFEQWTRGPAMPRYEGFWDYRPSQDRLVVYLHQVAPKNFTFKLPLELGIYTGEDAAPRIETIDVEKPEQFFTFDLGAKPARVVVDPRANALMAAHLEQK